MKIRKKPPENLKAKGKEKSRLHARNRHKMRYDFEKLCQVLPELSGFVQPNKYGDQSIDFANPDAVKTLNTALLKLDYNLQYWDIPDGYLCPPIPGRADYIHHIADILAGSNYGIIPKGRQIAVFDVGIGANCIYPIIGVSEYGWSFMGTEIDENALASAKKIIDLNESLKNNIQLKLQLNTSDIYYGTVMPQERYDLSICNPPFHASLEEAIEGSARKVKNLSGEKTEQPILNFGGQQQELWCHGGERRFIGQMIRQSKKFASNFLWFSTLVSKQNHVPGLVASLKQVAAVEIKIIPMGQGNKTSRLLAWTFKTVEEQRKWAAERWKKD